MRLFTKILEIKGLKKLGKLSPHQKQVLNRQGHNFMILKHIGQNRLKYLIPEKKEGSNKDKRNCLNLSRMKISN
jgi:hypothetical protein